MRKLGLSSLCALLVAVAVVPATVHAAAAPAAKPAAMTKAKMGDSAEDAIKKAEREFVAAWNAHDAGKMAAFWDMNGDLINPMGQNAKGRAEVEKLMAHEQSTMFKGSTYAIDSESIRMLSPTIAASDWDASVTGMTGPDGKPVPAFKHHVTVILRLEGGAWKVMVARPVQYPPMPPGAH